MALVASLIRVVLSLALLADILVLLGIGFDIHVKVFMYNNVYRNDDHNEWIWAKRCGLLTNCMISYPLSTISYYKNRDTGMLVIYVIL